MTGAVAWFTDAAGNSAGTTPAGIQVSEFETAANKATVTMTAAEQIAEGTYFFKVTIDGTDSAVATLKVNAAGTPALGLPTNLRVTDKTQTTAVLEWDAAENAESYIVRLDGDATYPVSALTHTLENLTAGTAYTWEVASVRGDEQSTWVAGEGFTTEEEELPALGLPSNLTVTGKTTTTASLKWDAADNAESYIVRLDGETTYPAAVLTYTFDNLTPGTAYTWEVASVRGDEQSAWVAGEGFTTETELPSKFFFVQGYYTSGYGHPYGEVLLTMTDYDPNGTDKNGMRINICLIMDMNDIDMDPSKDYMDIPVGTYNVSGTEAPYVIIRDSYVTTLVTIVNGSQASSKAITGGRMIISGNNTSGYSIDLDLTYTDGSYSKQGVGHSFNIVNPKLGGPAIANGNLGALTYNKTEHVPDAFPSIGCDAWGVRGVKSAGISFANGDWTSPRGTGYYIYSIQLSTLSGYPEITPGEYVITSNINARNLVLAGYLNSHNAKTGLYVIQYENDVEVASSPLVSGTITVSGNSSGYTMVLNAKDKKGTDFTATITR